MYASNNNNNLITDGNHPYHANDVQFDDDQVDDHQVSVLLADIQVNVEIRDSWSEKLQQTIFREDIEQLRVKYEDRYQLSFCANGHPKASSTLKKNLTKVQREIDALLGFVDQLKAQRHLPASRAKLRRQLLRKTHRTRNTNVSRSMDVVAMDFSNELYQDVQNHQPMVEAPPPPQHMMLEAPPPPQHMMIEAPPPQPMIQAPPQRLMIDAPPPPPPQQVAFDAELAAFGDRFQKYWKPHFSNSGKTRQEVEGTMRPFFSSINSLPERHPDVNPQYMAQELRNAEIEVEKFLVGFP